LAVEVVGLVSFRFIVLGRVGVGGVGVDVRPHRQKVATIPPQAGTIPSKKKKKEEKEKKKEKGARKERVPALRAPAPTRTCIHVGYMLSTTIYILLHVWT